MNVLSLFDGISCGQFALQRAGIKVDNYYASEIKPDAIRVTMDNFPNTIQLGDVCKLRDDIFNNLNPAWNSSIDLLIGGSPCQDLSGCNKNQSGLNGSKSILFYTYVDIFNRLRPKWFLLENVASMKKDQQDIITQYMGVEPIRINSKLVSAQLRDRLYWTNIPTSMPVDKGITLQGVLTSGYTNRNKARCLLESDSRPLSSQEKMARRYEKGFTTIIAEQYWNTFSASQALKTGVEFRYLNQTELERLQTLPDGYTKVLNRNKAAGVIGDAWTVDVISHIFSGLT